MPAATRQKKPAVTRATPETREQMEALVGEIASIVVDRAAMLAEMDGRIQNIRAEYEARFAEGELLQEANMAAAERWALANKTVFAGNKSVPMLHGTVGFRTGMPRLKTIRGVTWSGVLELLTRGKMFAYIRTRTEPDKEKLIADRDKLGDLALIGLDCVQDETFFVDPKLEKD